jgi:hypothetical protein
MELLGRPAANVGAAVQENLHPPDYAGLVDLNAGKAHRPFGDGERNALVDWAR